MPIRTDSSTPSTVAEIVAAEQAAAALTPASGQGAEVDSYLAKKRENLTNFQTAKINLQQLINSWKPERDQVEANRRLRDIDLSPKQLRQEGKLLPDETLVPQRLVDTNITREKPAYTNYLKNSPRIAVFHNIEDPAFDCQQLEAEFTRVLQYNEWDIPFIRCIDGAQAQGKDYLEVVFDPSKPGNVAIEHVGADNLFYNKDSINLQANDKLVRRYSFSLQELEDAAQSNGFDPGQVEKCCKLHEGEEAKNRNIEVYKVLFKLEGKIWSAWFELKATDSWLKTPAPHYVGMQEQVTKMVEVPQAPLLGMFNRPPLVKPVMTLEDKAVTIFPIFCFIYKETETQQISTKKGRVFLDKHKQEAQTAIASNYINALGRASKVYGSVQNGDMGDGAPPKQLESPLVNGGIYDKPVNFFGFPWPDTQCISALQHFDVSNSQEVGQVNFAAANRKDSRKTATEIGAAQEQATQLTSDQVSQLSTFLRLVYSFCWIIIQNRAINKKITFLSKVEQRPDMASMGNVVIYVNDVETISKSYDIKPSGDIDVIKRREKLSQLKQDMPLFANTPLATVFLKEIIQTAYPDNAAKWIPLLETGMAKDQVIMQFLQLMQMAAPLMQQLPPQLTQPLMMLAQQAQAALGGGAQSPSAPPNPQMQQQNMMTGIQVPTANQQAAA